MRTLFLLAILVTLAMIAIKKPDQSAWEAARELSTKIELGVADVPNLPEAPPLTGNAKKDFAAVQQRVRRAFEPADSDPPSAVEEKNSGGPGRAGDNPPMAVPKSKPELPLVDTRDAAGSSTRMKGGTSRSKGVDAPDLPPIPVPPAEIGKIGKREAPTLEKPEPRLRPGRDYKDVKEFYENASRLLAEIE